MKQSRPCTRCSADACSFDPDVPSCVTKRYVPSRPRRTPMRHVARNKSRDLVPSGSGQFHALRVLMTLDPLTDGRIEVDAEPRSRTR